MAKSQNLGLTEPSGYLTDGPINYKYKTKCTWLIEGYPNAVLRLRFNHFATECSWDHMYVYDGDSIYAPLVAVLSGLIVPEVRGNETVPEVVTTSGYALLHFFSDAAYNLTGFNIFYSINSCPNNCSGHGKCTASVLVASQVYCECDKYWKGEACDIPYCKANCGSPDHGYCDLTGEKLCVCNDSWQGPDCSLNVPSTESYWILPNVKPFSPSVGRASHKAVLHGKFMWVIGGYTFNYSSFQMVLKSNCFVYQCTYFNLQENIFMYGGRIETSDGNVTDELWVFNIPSQSWSTKTPTVLGHGQQYAVEGHSAHIMELDSRDVVMIVIFGYSAIYGYTSSIQEYHISSNTWLVPETKGAIVQGGYGHTSVYDEVTKSIYVHGGYKALPGNKYGLVDDLYKYEVNTKTCSFCVPRPLLLKYACDEWKTLPKPNLHRDVNRFGHSAVVINGSMYIFGGFSSVLLSDVLVYKPPDCRAFQDEELCRNAGPGIKCVWNKNHCESWETGNANTILRAKCPPKTAALDDRCYRYADCASCTANTNGCQWCDDKKCISANSNCSMSVRNYTKCHVRNEQICNKLTSCKSCSLNLNCQWDQRQQECQALPVSPNQNARPCKKPCSLRTSCSNCTSNGMECMWCGSTKRCVDSNAYIISFPYGQCLEWQTATCSRKYRAKKLGIRGHSKQWRFDFRHAILLGYNIILFSCFCPAAQNCSGLRTCGQCLEQPGCGWCNDPSDTGRGYCTEGSSRGPMRLGGAHGSEVALDTSLCPKEKNYEWSFIQCPACQCNGHSTCIDSNVCEQCKNLTTGKQCQDCMPGYYGDPTNGGQCTGTAACRRGVPGGVQCGRSTKASAMSLTSSSLHREHLRVKLFGQKALLRAAPIATRCDSENRYVGNPLRGTCYYSLLIDYQFTFSLLQEDDRHHTAINFIANPEQYQSYFLHIHILGGTISGEETPIVSKTNIREYRDSFSYEKFNFRSNPNITFYVYVSNFSWPIKIQGPPKMPEPPNNWKQSREYDTHIPVTWGHVHPPQSQRTALSVQKRTGLQSRSIAFSQHNTIMDLVQFFVTFFSWHMTVVTITWHMTTGVTITQHVTAVVTITHHVAVVTITQLMTGVTITQPCAAEDTKPAILQVLKKSLQHRGDTETWPSDAVVMYAV
ncbi:attractin [Cricetulus griseus]|nr:attractin [Cricetulus griseus]